VHVLVFPAPRFVRLGLCNSGTTADKLLEALLHALEGLGLNHYTAHMLGGCRDPHMWALFTARHDNAARILIEHLRKGAHGSFYMLADVGKPSSLEPLGGQRQAHPPVDHTQGGTHHPRGHPHGPRAGTPQPPGNETLAPGNHHRRGRAHIPGRPPEERG
jgi:hypothetical protein